MEQNNVAIVVHVVITFADAIQNTATKMKTFNSKLYFGQCKCAKYSHFRYLLVLQTALNCI